MANLPTQRNSEVRNGISYQLPWVEGPNNWNKPFGLNTKYGHLMFVFHLASPLFDSFFLASAKALKPGFKLGKYLILAPNKEGLVVELTTHMPEDLSFAVVFEGTDEFEQCMNELADDTIWNS